jgi:hypothetical protein
MEAWRSSWSTLAHQLEISQRRLQRQISCDERGELYTLSEGSPPEQQVLQ